MKGVVQIILIVVALVGLSSCGHTVQTTSGRDYLSRYPSPAAYPTQAQSEGH